MPLPTHNKTGQPTAPQPGKSGATNEPSNTGAAAPGASNGPLKPEPACGPLDETCGVMFQLAHWALNPATDPTELEDRRSQIRTLLLALVDRVAPVYGPSPATSGSYSDAPKPN